MQRQTLFGSPAFSTEMRIELKMNTFRIKHMPKSISGWMCCGADRTDTMKSR